MKIFPLGMFSLKQQKYAIVFDNCVWMCCSHIDLLHHCKYHSLVPLPVFKQIYCTVRIWTSYNHNSATPCYGNYAKSWSLWHPCVASSCFEKLQYASMYTWLLSANVCFTQLHYGSVINTWMADHTWIIGMSICLLACYSRNVTWY